MDINHEYAAHQSALMRASSAGSADQRRDQRSRRRLLAARGVLPAPVARRSARRCVLSADFSSAKRPSRCRRVGC